MHDDLVFLYQQLRQELEAAYAAVERDNGRIDRIALDLMHLERSLAAVDVSACRFVPQREQLLNSQPTA